MPYISQAQRKHLNSGGSPDNAGELNYLVTILIHRYLAANGASFQQMNDIVGALESAKHEFQRRVVDPYEDLKRAENGDVP